MVHIFTKSPLFPEGLENDLNNLTVGFLKELKNIKEKYNLEKLYHTSESQKGMAYFVNDKWDTFELMQNLANKQVNMGYDEYHRNNPNQ